MQVGEAMEGWYFDTGASGHMSPSSDGMTNFQPCNKFLRVANGVTFPIEGKGNLVVEFQSGLESVPLQLHEVAYVSKLSYHLLSLSKAVEQGRKYIGDKNELTMMLNSGKQLLVPNVRNMYLTYGYRPESDVEQACAVIAPGLLPTTGVDINHYHRTTAYTHTRLLRATAEQQGVRLDLKSKLLPCVGCSAANGLSARLNKITECRSDKKSSIFVDESGEKPVASIGGKKYSIIFRDDATRMSWIYFMRKKSEFPDALDQFLADTRKYGPPKIIRTDDAPQLKAGKFDEICRKLYIKREFTFANTPQLNGVAERGLKLIEKVAKTSVYQAKVSFVGMDLPPIDRLWTDNHHNACDVLNRSATKSNKGMTTPYKMWHGVKPSPTLIQWLQPCFYRVKHKHKTDAQAKPGLYVGPARNHPRDSMRIYSQETGKIVISRDVPWRHVPTPPLPSVPQSIFAPSERGETESTADDRREGREGTSRQGGGGVEESDSDDDLEVTWESDTPDAAEGTDDAISDKPVASEGSSPSTVISRPGTFVGGESISPSNSSNSSSSNSSKSIGRQRAVNSNVAQLPEELPKGEKNRLESWPFRGQPLVSSRMRQRQVVGEPEEESEYSEHALIAELREPKKLGQEDKSEEGLGGYDYNVLSDSLALRPLEFDVEEPNNNVLSLISSMDDEYDDIALVVKGTEGESQCEMPYGPISEAETPPVSVGGVLKSRYKGA